MRNLLNLRHAGFAYIRIPQKPFSFLETAFPSGGELRGCLARLLEDQTIREAISLASPKFLDRLDCYLATADGDPAILLAATRYVVRMASRCTPFGTFSAIGKLRITDAPGFSFEPSFRRTLKLDGAYAYECFNALSRDHIKSFRFIANDTLYASNGGLRFYESRGTIAERQYALSEIEVEDDSLVLKVVEFCKTPRSVSEIVAEIGGDVREASVEEVEEFVIDLVTSNVLLHAEEPPLTGEGAFLAVSAAALKIKSTAAIESIRAISEEFTNLQQCALGESIDSYAKIALAAKEICDPAKQTSAFQVDCHLKPSKSHIDEKFVQRLLKEISILWSLRNQAYRPLDAFCALFTERFGDAEVGLLEALDDENGIPFNENCRSIPDALKGLPLAGGIDLRKGMIEEGGLKKLRSHILGAIRDGVDSIDISQLSLNTDADKSNSNPLHGYLHFSLIDETVVGMKVGECVHLKTIGVSGMANLLTRFADGSDELRHDIRTLCEIEAADFSTAVVAEIVHLPDAKTENVIRRPRTRDVEFTLLARSGSVDATSLPLSDLTVSVRGTNVTLFSKTLRKRVFPRLTTAGNYSNASLLGVYTFLGQLQSHGATLPRLGWPYEFLNYSYLPRLVFRNIVLEPRSWLLDAAVVGELKSNHLDSEWLNLFMKKYGFPRWCAHSQLDQILPFDWTNDALRAAVVDGIRPGPTRIEEWLPPKAPASAEMTRPVYANEIVLPFYRAPVEEPAHPVRHAKLGENRCEIVGSWLYAKIYCGRSATDALLRQKIHPFIVDHVNSGEIQSWFFIRYHDPLPHIRLRLLLGDASQASIAARFLEFLATLQSSGQVWKTTLDCYEPETIRYGGPIGLVVCEQIFAADTELFFRMQPSESDSHLDWLDVVATTYTFSRALTLNDGSMLRRMFSELAAGFRKEFGDSRSASNCLSAKWRENGKTIASRLFAESLVPTMVSVTVGGLARQLATLSMEGQLVEEWGSVIKSLIHMHVNRFVSVEPRTYELLVYDSIRRFLNVPPHLNTSQ